jgi:hypothetical protein
MYFYHNWLLLGIAVSKNEIRSNKENDERTFNYG